MKTIAHKKGSKLSEKAKMKKLVIGKRQYRYDLLFKVRQVVDDLDNSVVIPLPKWKKMKKQTDWLRNKVNECAKRVEELQK